MRRAPPRRTGRRTVLHRSRGDRRHCREWCQGSTLPPDRTTVQPQCASVSASDRQREQPREHDRGSSARSSSTKDERVLATYNPVSLIRHAARCTSHHPRHPLNPQLALLQPYPFERLRALFASVTPDPRTNRRSACRSANRAIRRRAHPRRARSRRSGARKLSHNGRRARAARGDRRVARAPARTAAARSGDAGAAGPRQPRGVVLVRADGHRCQSRRRNRCRSQSVLPDLRRRDAAGRRHAVLRQQSGCRRFRACDGATCRQTCGRARNLLYVCSPDNPTGRVMTQDEWQLSVRTRGSARLRHRRRRVLLGESTSTKPGRRSARLPRRAPSDAIGYRRLLSFGSLSKRSNAPGLRSGYVAGDAALVKAFLLYRTYHGSAMSSAVAAASIAAWNDEAHVRANRALYAEKFIKLAPRVRRCPCPRTYPTRRSISGLRFRATMPNSRATSTRDEAVSVLPGSFIAPRVGRRESGPRLRPHRAGRLVR